MPRGPKKHLKRLYAPKHWNLGKMEGVWAPRPSPGPHKLRECLPVSIIVRNKLKYALTMQEVKAICMEKNIKVDGKTRTDVNFPAGFMDVVSIEKTEDLFRLLYNTNGCFILHRIDKSESDIKLCKVKKQAITKKAIPYIVTHDGRTIRYADPLIKTDDTVCVNLTTGKCVDLLKFAVGCQVMITGGRNCGRIGTLTGIEKHAGSFTVCKIRDSVGATFATRKGNCFVVSDGKKESPVTLPHAGGVKVTVVERTKNLKTI